MQKGSKNYGEMVTQKAIEILETHRAEPLPLEVGRAIDEIFRKAETTLVDKHFVA